MAAPEPADRPAPARFAVAAAALLVLGALAVALGAPADVGAALVVAAVVLGAGALLLRRSHRRGEPAEHAHLLDALGPAGEEDVLVLGDGRLAAAARRRLAHGRVEHLAGEPADLPHPAGSFDAVVSALALHHLPDGDARARVCAELARVVRPGGRVVLLEFFRVSGDLERGLEGAGLAEVRRSGLRPAVFPPARRVSGRRPAVRVD